MSRAHRRQAAPPPPEGERPDDLALLARALAPVEKHARKLPWATERAWTARSHLWWEGDTPTLDLHELDARLARDALKRLFRLAPELRAGAVRIVAGQGHHSPGGQPVLLELADRMLASACEREPAWTYRVSGPGRFTLVVDPKRAPGETGRLGLGFWAVAAALLAGLVYAFPPSLVLLVPLGLVGLVSWLRSRKRGGSGD